MKEGEIEATTNEYKLFNFRKTEDGQYSLRWKEGEIEATTNGI